MNKKLTLYLAGSNDGLPTLEEIIWMTQALTGRAPTPEEIEEARQILDSLDDTEEE